MTSVFAAHQDKAWPYTFKGRIRVDCLAGGIPTNPRVAEGWLRKSLAANDDLIRAEVAEVMVARGVTADTAVAEVDTLRHLRGFKSDDDGLYIEGRQLKACLKESGSIAMAAGKLKRKWGLTGKGIESYLAEHVFVGEDKLHLHDEQNEAVREPTDTVQRFVHTWRGSSIEYVEYIEGAEFDFTVITDENFTAEEWAVLWLTAEQEGIGATRSQGFGRFEVIEWRAA